MLEVKYALLNPKEPMENGSGVTRFHDDEELILFIQEHNAKGTTVAIVQIN